jgi:hypothetical protein
MWCTPTGSTCSLRVSTQGRGHPPPTLPVLVSSYGWAWSGHTHMYAPCRPPPMHPRGGAMQQSSCYSTHTLSYALVQPKARSGAWTITCSSTPCGLLHHASAVEAHGCGHGDLHCSIPSRLAPSPAHTTGQSHAQTAHAVKTYFESMHALGRHRTRCHHHPATPQRGDSR